MATLTALPGDMRDITQSRLLHSFPLNLPLPLLLLLLWMAYNLRLYVLAPAKRSCAKTYNQDYNEAHLDLDLPAFTFSKLS